MKKKFGKYGLILLLLLGGCIADFQTKLWAQKNLKGKPPVSVIRGFLEVGFLENRGMVFGILNKSDNAHGFISAVTWVRAAVSIAVLIIIVLKRRMPFYVLAPFLLIWMGAVGNLIDAFKLGYVIDFIHIHAGEILDWPFFFNLADAYVCIGTGMLFVSGSFSKKAINNA
jgi:signal peptidase II